MYTEPRRGIQSGNPSVESFYRLRGYSIPVNPLRSVPTKAEHRL